MYRSFTIKNFRCFHDLTIAPLERVNLIAGKNNVGKTTLLEALFLHMGPNNPYLSVVVNLIRGIAKTALPVTDMWEWLFFDKRINERIEIKSLAEGNQPSTLIIRLEESKEPRFIPAASGEGTPTKIAEGLTATMPRDLVLEYVYGDGQVATSHASIAMDGIKVESAALPLSLNAFVISGGTRGSLAHIANSDAEAFSNLSRVGRQNDVLVPLKLLEPRLHDLTVLVSGGKPMIYGDIGIRELLPLPLMGEGIDRLLSIVLGIATVPHGNLLIDEIENGLHHSVMVKVWKAIALAARQYDVQVFATTHSWECIQAAHTAFTEDGTYDFHLHRLDRINDEIRAVTYDQQTLATSIEMNLEIR